jgi:hypothetical protein
MLPSPFPSVSQSTFDSQPVNLMTTFATSAAPVYSPVLVSPVHVTFVPKTVSSVTMAPAFIFVVNLLLTTPENHW